jgi:hypothetical protein
MTEKKTNFHCIKCDYTCSRKFLFEQHVKTNKHLKQFSATPLKYPEIIADAPKKVSIYGCTYCGKTYKQRSGIWRHKAKCEKLNKSAEEINNNNNSENGGSINNKLESSLENTNSDDLKVLMKQMIGELNKDSIMKNNMMERIKEQNNIIHEMIPKIGNNNNNNRFNINLFLNEKCRDAINMTDFIESLQIHLEDLVYTKNNGLVEGISSLFLNGLKRLDTYKRPIHCSDIKRETLYIKENNEWECDNGKEILRSAISNVANRQRKSISEWVADNPTWMESDKGKDEYIQIVQSLMTDLREGQCENKIIKSIAKEMVIDKGGMIV